MLKKMTTTTSRKRIRRKHIFWMSILCQFLALWLFGDFNRAVDAAPLFDKFTTYIQTQGDTFLTAAGAAEGIKTTIKAFLGIIPWAIILMVGAVVSWQAYSGYQAYEREDMAGTGKCVLNIVVMLLLTVASSAVTDFFVGGAAAPGA
jgi:hypothetical protein